MIIMPAKEKAVVAIDEKIDETVEEVIEEKVTDLATREAAILEANAQEKLTRPIERLGVHMKRGALRPR